ncbi:Hypothetical protein OINT_2000236 [Brucella intermedia LMG 3301]|uniref:Uncharacterized protein n=1 Tax=Brucella intermedia LMG 3301 TaxID=641118 RepID=C4WMA5_9HYPH|nr:Hypothetical protein OINT_2000236 [Brucella intermedia LMG 3301]
MIADTKAQALSPQRSSAASDEAPQVISSEIFTERPDGTRQEREHFQSFIALGACTDELSSRDFSVLGEGRN